MALRYQSLELKHAATPRLQHFALLAGLEAAVRGTLISTIPIAVYDAFGSAQNLSTVYFTAGVITLFWGLMVPRLTQIWPRRWVYSAGCIFYLIAMSPQRLPLNFLTKSISARIRPICLRWRKLTSSGTSLIYPPKTWLLIATFILWEVAP